MVIPKDQHISEVRRIQHRDGIPWWLFRKKLYEAVNTTFPGSRICTHSADGKQRCIPSELCACWPHVSSPQLPSCSLKPPSQEQSHPSPGQNTLCLWKPAGLCHSVTTHGRHEWCSSMSPGSWAGDPVLTQCLPGATHRRLPMGPSADQIQSLISFCLEAQWSVYLQTPQPYEWNRKGRATILIITTWQEFY